MNFPASQDYLNSKLDQTRADLLINTIKMLKMFHRASSLSMMSITIRREKPNEIYMCRIRKILLIINEISYLFKLFSCIDGA